MRPEAITASVNKDVCAGCGICATLCPYSAIEINTENGRRVSNVISALCKGCGTCGAACPSGAISMNHFTDEQLFTQIEANGSHYEGNWLKIKVALVPPKPKALERAIFTLASLATLGT